MRTSFGLGMMILLATSGLIGCAGGEERPSTGKAGNGAAGTGSAGTGAAGTGAAGTGAAGTGSAGTGSAGAAGTGSAGTGASNNDGGADTASNNTDANVARDVVSADGTAKSRHTKRPINMPYAKNGYWEYLPPGYGDG